MCLCYQLQHVAAACVQRNVRKLMGIREWQWWRLYTKVKPLLNVQRTEEELRDKEVCLGIILWFRIILEVSVCCAFCKFFRMEAICL